jgi:aldose 1-epimerase
VSSPTGDQFVITRPTATGESRAIITQLAAALRNLTVDGVDLTEPYGDDVPTPGGNGIVAVPWPNRIDDGMWVLDGVQQNLDISEVRHNNAIHGLLRFTPYALEHRTDSSVTLAATVYPQHGYPFKLATKVTYELVEGGISVWHNVTNVGTAKAPVALGTHPYLRVGDAPLDDLVLTVNAGTRFEATQRQIPFAEMPVMGTDTDLRHGRLLSSLRLDETFGELAVVGDRHVHTLEAPNGRRVSLWQDKNFGFVQIFTPRNYQRASGPGLAVAIEPMTAPPNALVTKRALTWIDPGETWTVNWGISYDPGPHA